MIGVCAAVLAAAIFLPSCDKKAEDPAATTFDVDKKYERGPVTMHVKLNRKEISIAERLTLRLEVTAEESYEIEWPKLGEKLAQFGIVDYDSPVPALAKGGRVLYVRSYELEPFLSGEYKIPPLKVTFWKKAEAQPKKHDLESEELTVNVKSLLPEKAGALKIKDLVGPMEMPGGDRRWLYLAAGLIGAAVVAGGGVIFWRRRKNGPAAILARIPAHELAYRELERLLADKLIEQGQMKLFYIRISDILRHYIENRFALHAPERTTEEFLAELQRSTALASDHKVLLKEFLLHCDLVKFAELLPTNDQIQKTFDLCKQFIVETQLREEQSTAA